MRFTIILAIIAMLLLFGCLGSNNSNVNSGSTINAVKTQNNSGSNGQSGNNSNTNDLNNNVDNTVKTIEDILMQGSIVKCTINGRDHTSMGETEYNLDIYIKENKRRVIGKINATSGAKKETTVDWLIDDKGLYIKKDVFNGFGNQDQLGTLFKDCDWIYFKNQENAQVDTSSSEIDYNESWDSYQEGVDIKTSLSERHIKCDLYNGEDPFVLNGKVCDFLEIIHNSYNYQIPQ